MLEGLVNFFTSFIITSIGFYIIKQISTLNIKYINKKTLFLITISSVVTAILQSNEYMGIHTLLIFTLNSIIYKKIFSISYNDSIIATGISMALMFMSELITAILLIPMLPQNQLENSIYLKLIINILIGLATISILNINYILFKLRKFYKNIKKNKNIGNIVFFTLIIILTAFFTFDVYSDYSFSYKNISNFITMITILTLMFIFINNKNEYNQLSMEYDTLFSYIQNFEEWIEKEQLNRHEYKNQLAVLRCITDEDKVKNKIDEILEDNIKIEGELVSKLKVLPKGGIKGLMYYKSAIAQKNNIKLTVDVSIERKSILNSLNENQIKILCNLIGIYYDNAIEAAKENRKKVILVEIYELKDKLNIVISNTFKKTKDFDKRNEKGISTKGEGRGNGLYFAHKLISKNNWITQKQEIIDGYYIQTISIKKLDT